MKRTNAHDTGLWLRCLLAAIDLSLYTIVLLTAFKAGSIGVHLLDQSDVPW